MVAWSPLGGGFLTGTVREVAAGDFRTSLPRFSPGNLAANNERFAPIRGIAATSGSPRPAAPDTLTRIDEALSRFTPTGEGALL